MGDRVTHFRVDNVWHSQTDILAAGECEEVENQDEVVSVCVGAFPAVLDGTSRLGSSTCGLRPLGTNDRRSRWHIRNLESNRGG